MVHNKYLRIGIVAAIIWLAIGSWVYFSDVGTVHCVNLQTLESSSNASNLSAYWRTLTLGQIDLYQTVFPDYEPIQTTLSKPRPVCSFDEFLLSGYMAFLSVPFLLFVLIFVAIRFVYQKS